MILKRNQIEIRIEAFGNHLSNASIRLKSNQKRGKGNMRAIDVLARAFSEAMGKPEAEGEIAKSIIDTAPADVRALMWIQLPDSQAQEQLAELRQPAMHKQIKSWVVAGAIRFNRQMAGRG